MYIAIRFTNLLGRLYAIYASHLNVLEMLWNGIGLEVRLSEQDSEKVFG